MGGRRGCSYSNCSYVLSDTSESASQISEKLFTWQHLQSAFTDKNIKHSDKTTSSNILRQSAVPDSCEEGMQNKKSIQKSGSLHVVVYLESLSYQRILYLWLSIFNSHYNYSKILPYISSGMRLAILVENFGCGDPCPELNSSGNFRDLH